MRLSLAKLSVFLVLAMVNLFPCSEHSTPSHYILPPFPTVYLRPILYLFLVSQCPPKGATIPYRPKMAAAPMTPVILAGGQAYAVQGQYVISQPQDVSSPHQSLCGILYCI